MPWELLAAASGAQGLPTGMCDAMSLKQQPPVERAGGRDAPLPCCIPTLRR